MYKTESSLFPFSLTHTTNTFPLLSVFQARHPQPPTDSANSVVIRYISPYFLPIIASATYFTSISLINIAWRKCLQETQRACEWYFWLFFLRKQSEMIFYFFYSFVLCVEEENNVNLSYFCFYFFEFVLFCCYPVYDFSFFFFFFICGLVNAVMCLCLWQRLGFRVFLWCGN
jgi:hypothetical protein